MNLPELMRQPGFAGLQHYWMTPWFHDVRFGRWEAIRARPNPAPDLPYVTAIWHYAQAMAAVRQKREADAAKHHAALAALARRSRHGDADGVGPLPAGPRGPDRGAHGAARNWRCCVATREAAIAALREAVAIEEKIPYDEPPGWHAPVRQSLGAVLLEAGRGAEAETVYREELQRNPANGWSLKGLALALEQQGKRDEARLAGQEFDRAWQHADVQLVASRF